MTDHPKTHAHARVHPLFKPTLEPEYYETGMTIREAFAMAAMQGLCAALDYGAGVLIPDDISGDAVHIADALIAELNK